MIDLSGIANILEIIRQIVSTANNMETVVKLPYRTFEAIDRIEFKRLEDRMVQERFHRQVSHCSQKQNRIIPEDNFIMCEVPSKKLDEDAKNRDRLNLELAKFTFEGSNIFGWSYDRLYGKNLTKNEAKKYLPDFAFGLGTDCSLNKYNKCSLNEGASCSIRKGTCCLLYEETICPFIEGTSCLIYKN